MKYKLMLFLGPVISMSTLWGGAYIMVEIHQRGDWWGLPATLTLTLSIVAGLIAFMYGAVEGRS